MSERAFMERMADEDTRRHRAGHVGLPAHVVAQMSRDAGNYGTILSVNGHTMRADDPFWMRYDAYLRQRQQGLGAVSSLPAGATCGGGKGEGNYTYSGDDGLCHKNPGSTLGPMWPAQKPPSCDNGGVWNGEAGTCDLYAGMSPGGDPTISGEAVDAWRNELPGEPDASPPEGMSKGTKAAIVLGVLALVGGGYYAWSRKK